MTYQPKPIDTSGIALSDDLIELREKLAENAHEHWAIQRISDGWTFGSKRNDDAKTHPDLVPYGELSDDEKDYDRVVAMETLKAIVALGYRITKG